MRSILLLSIPTFALACAPPPADGRSIEGVAQSGTSALVAIDSAGNAFKATPIESGAFHIDVTSTLPFTLFATRGDAVSVVRFAKTRDGSPTEHTLPSYTGTVSVGALSTCDCNDDGAEDEEAAEDNPLDQIDQDDDGENDLDDADDDGDGENDDADGDDDGEDGEDAGDDLDTDDDGTPDLADDDDDDDGENDDVDTDDGDDSDDDGVSDADDEDDDNDGESDDADDDDDGDGEADDDGETDDDATP